jgi:hypothetical protein
MTRKLTKRDRATMWRLLPSLVPDARNEKPHDAAANDRFTSQSVEAAELRSAVDIRFGIGLFLLALVTLTVLIGLPAKPWKWMFYLADLGMVIAAAWYVDRGNRRLRRIVHGVDKS